MGMPPVPVLGGIGQAIEILDKAADLTKKLGSILPIFGVGGPDIREQLGVVVSNQNKILEITTLVLGEVQSLRQEVAQGFANIQQIIGNTVNEQLLVSAEREADELRRDLFRAAEKTKDLTKPELEKHRGDIRGWMHSFFTQERNAGVSYGYLHTRVRTMFTIEYFLALAVPDQADWADIPDDYRTHIRWASDANGPKRGSLVDIANTFGVSRIESGRALIAQGKLPDVIAYEDDVYMWKRLMVMSEDYRKFGVSLQSLPAQVAKLSEWKS